MGIVNKVQNFAARNGIAVNISKDWTDGLNYSESFEDDGENIYRLVIKDADGFGAESQFSVSATHYIRYNGKHENASICLEYWGSLYRIPQSQEWSEPGPVWGDEHGRAIFYPVVTTDMLPHGTNLVKMDSGPFAGYLTAELELPHDMFEVLIAPAKVALMSDCIADEIVIRSEPDKESLDISKLMPEARARYRAYRIGNVIGETLRFARIARETDGAIMVDDWLRDENEHYIIETIFARYLSHIQPNLRSCWICQPCATFKRCFGYSPGKKARAETFADWLNSDMGRLRAKFNIREFSTDGLLSLAEKNIRLRAERMGERKLAAA